MREAAKEPVSVGRAGSAPAAEEEVSERSYRVKAIVKKPVTVTIEKRFGRNASPRAAAAPVVDPPRDAQRVADTVSTNGHAVEPVAPNEAPQAAQEKPAGGRRPKRAEPDDTTTPPPAKEIPRRRSSASPDRAITPEPHATQRKRRPVQAKAERAIDLPAAPKLERRPEAPASKSERRPEAPASVASDKLEMALAKIDVLSARVEELEARLSQISNAATHKRVSRWRRLFED